MIASDYLESALRPVRRATRFWWVGLMASAAVLAATLIAASVGRKYRSEAVVYYREGLQWTENEGLSTRRIGNRLKDILLARIQLARIIQELDLYPKLVKAGRMAEAVEEMRVATTFKVSEGDIFVISYTGDSPDEAQRVTARLTDVLIDENARLRSEQAEVAREFLDAEKKRNAAELSAKETELLRFLAKHPEFAHEQGTMGASLRITARKGGDAGPRVGKGDGVLGALRREEERLRRQIQSPSQIPPTPRDPALLAAKNEAEATLKAAQRELASRRARFTEQHPDVRSAAAMVKEASDAYKRTVDALNAAERLEVEPRSALEARLGQVRQEIAAYDRKNPKEKAEPTEPVEGGDAAQRIVALETEWARLNREVGEARERFQQLDARQFMASMVATTTVSGQAAQIVVIDPAYRPAHPIGMSRMRAVLMGLAMALTFGMGLALLLGVLDDRVYDRVDLERLEVAPLLVEVEQRGLPQPGSLEAKGKRRRDAPAELTSAEMSVVRSLREALTAALHEEPRIETLPAEKVVAVSDDALVAGEGSQGAAESGAREGAGPRPVAPEGAPREGPAPAVTQLAPQGEAAAHTAVLPPATPGRQAQDLVSVHRAASPQSIDPRLVMLSAPDSPAAASFRVLRHRLRERRGLQAMLVASAGAGEGKTLCAVNLALALGEAGRARVVLVEANLRYPALARLLGLQPPVCVSEQLELHRERPLQPWVVVESVAPWLHVAAVEPDIEVRPLLDGRALTLGIEKLRRASYDFIVIDSPAILGSADANLIEESVDGILIATWAGKTRGRALRTAVEQIGTGKLLGVALLGT